MAEHPTKLKFDPEWRTSLLTALLLPLLVALGFWQLDRAEEKAALGDTWDMRRQQLPQPIQDLQGLGPAQLAYLPVQLRGKLLPDEYFLLDNRIKDRQFGYEVVSILRLHDTGQLVLLNRGWIKGDPARLVLPEVETPQEEVSVTGHVYVSPGDPYLLGEQELSGGWPKRVQALEMEKFSPVIEAGLDGTVFPYPVRIDDGQPGALAVDWQIVNVSPAKHRGYAVQWFTMAVFLVIFYILRSSNLWSLLRRKEED